MGVFIDLTGQKFGRLEVKSRATNRGKATVWNCLCDCGIAVPVRASNLMRGKTKSCKCGLRDWIKDTKRLRPYESLYNFLVYRCSRKKSKARCFLSYEQFVGFTKTPACFYCGESVMWAEFGLDKNGMACNLDRKDSSGHYTIENCVVCCPICNSLKSTFSQAVFVAKVKQIAKNLGDLYE